VSTAGSGIDFFVDYAEAEGALAERVPEGALLVLPEPMRTALHLPEELGLTEDPETAREDEFLLVTAGHPLLMTAAGTVLARGDVGCSSLPRPPGLPPTPSALVDKAREQIQTDHGRIDVAGTPQATHLVVLRVGALLTYSVSIDERVQELEEVWVVADSGRAIPAELCERLRAGALEPRVEAGMTAPNGHAVAQAHDLLCARARRRVEELSRQTSTRLRGQLDVLDDYYGRVLSSIDERLGRAGSDRVTMLTEQADATRREWTRRRSEVADDLTPTFEVQPFRLHLVAVPAYSVPAVIRRGARVHPVSLHYLPVLSSYLPPTCPSCGAEAILVAGKDRLGCRSCMAAPLQTVPAPATNQPADRTPREPEAKPAPSPPPPSGTPTPSTSPLSTSRSRPTPARPALAPKRASGRVTPKGSAGRPKAQSGIRMASSFWESVHSRELRPRDAVLHSPMRTLLRLYGALGPTYVVGVADPEGMTGLTATAVVVGPDGTCTTNGEVQCAGEGDRPYALFWRSGSRSNLLEVEAFPLEELGPLLARRDEWGKVYRQRWRHWLTPPPKPIIELDPTAALLLKRAAQFAGLGYAIRCLAAWEYVTERDDRADSATERPDPSRAAAIESIVSKRLDMRITVPALAARYECPVESVRRHLKSLTPVVRDCTGLRW
jgi:hypothetical protein